MKLPVILIVFYYAFSLGVYVEKEEETTSTSFLNCLINTTILAGLLFWAGFFSEIGWPQILWLSLIALAVGMFISNNFQPIVAKKNVWSLLLAYVFVFFLYYSAGIFNKSVDTL